MPLKAYRREGHWQVCPPIPVTTFQFDGRNPVKKANSCAVITWTIDSGLPWRNPSRRPPPKTQDQRNGQPLPLFILPSTSGSKKYFSKGGLSKKSSKSRRSFDPWFRLIPG